MRKIVSAFALALGLLAAPSVQAQVQNQNMNVPLVCDNYANALKQLRNEHGERIHALGEVLTTEEPGRYVMHVFVSDDRKTWTLGVLDTQRKLICFFAAGENWVEIKIEPNKAKKKYDEREVNHK